MVIKPSYTISAQNQTSPGQIIIGVNIPGILSAELISAEVTDSSLRLQAQDDSGIVIYALELELPVIVKSSSCHSRFNRKKSELTFTFQKHVDFERDAEEKSLLPSLAKTEVKSPNLLLIPASKVDGLIEGQKENPNSPTDCELYEDFYGAELVGSKPWSECHSSAKESGALLCVNEGLCKVEEAEIVRESVLQLEVDSKFCDDISQSGESFPTEVGPHLAAVSTQIKANSSIISGETKASNVAVSEYGKTGTDACVPLQGDVKAMSTANATCKPEQITSSKNAVSGNLVLVNSNEKPDAPNHFNEVNAEPTEQKDIHMSGTAKSNPQNVVSKTNQSVNQTEQSHAPTHAQKIESVRGDPCPQLAPSINASGIAMDLAAHQLSAYASPQHARKSSKKLSKDIRKRVVPVVSSVAAQLQSCGWAVCDNFVPTAAVKAVRSEIEQMQPHYTPGEIWVGKAADIGATISMSDVRGDSVLWLDKEALNAVAFVKEGKKCPCNFTTLRGILAAVDALIMTELSAVVPALAGAKSRSDAMMAVYPGSGTRFAKHVDNTADDGRILTVLLYLNPAWEPHLGGALRIYPAMNEQLPAATNGSTAVSKPASGCVYDVLPLAGRIAMFYSATIPHEVLPCKGRRHAMTVWYYDAEARKRVVGRAMSTHIPKGTSDADQATARDFIADILAGQTGQGDDKYLELRKRARAMSQGAAEIAAAVVIGRPDAKAFWGAMNVMGPTDLETLRVSLEQMGLGGGGHAPAV